MVLCTAENMSNIDIGDVVDSPVLFLATDKYQVQMYRRLCLFQRRGNGHFSLNRISLLARESSMSDSSVDTCPPFVSSMVIGEHEKPGMLENAVAFGEHGCQFVGEENRTRILDFVFPSRRCGFGIIQKLVQPVKEKIGELGVVNIVEEWGVGYNDIYTAIWNTGTTGIALIEVNRVVPVQGKFVGHRNGERSINSSNFSVLPRCHVEFRWISLVGKR